MDAFQADTVNQVEASCSPLVALMLVVSAEYQFSDGVNVPGAMRSDVLRFVAKAREKLLAHDT